MISVIIPVYNRSKTIRRAIDSVLNQTFKDFELIIVDDCSSDDSCEIVRSYNDPKIRLLQHAQNGGAAMARNTGIKAAKYDLIALLDSDDYYEDFFLESSFETINNTPNQIGFMWCGMRLLNGKQEKIELWIPERKGSIYNTFLHSLQIGTCAGIVIKKVVFEKLGYFDNTLPAAEDTEFFLRIAKEFEYAINEKIAINIVRDGDDRLSKDFSKIADAYNDFLPKHFDYIKKNKVLSRKYFYKMMWLNYYIKNKKNSRNYFFKLLKDFNLNSKIILMFFIFELLPIRIAAKIHQNRF